MAQAINLLTYLDVKNAVCEGTSPLWLRDGGNLYCRVDPNQSKYWIVRWKKDNKSNMRGIGTFPETTLTQARSIRDEYKALLKQGVDPKIEQKKARFTKVESSKVTFKKAFLDCFQHHANKKSGAWSKGHKKRSNSIFTKYLNDYLGDLPLTEITDEMILEVLESIYKKAPSTCQKAKHLISVVFKYAKDKRIFKGFNPVMHLQGNSLIAPQPVKHRVELHAHEVGEFMYKTSQLDNLFLKHFLYTQLVTCLRVGSLRNCKWGYYNDKYHSFEIPDEFMKGRKFFRCPLPTQLIPILEELRQHGDKNKDIIFKGSSREKGEEGTLSGNTPNDTIKDRLGFMADAHGLRTCFNKVLTKTKKFSIEVIEAQMSHKFATDIRLAYLGGEDYFEERQELVQYFADWCDKQLEQYKEDNGLA